MVFNRSEDVFTHPVLGFSIQVMFMTGYIISQTNTASIEVIEEMQNLFTYYGKESGRQIN